jgi:hypothetical protein
VSPGPDPAREEAERAADEAGGIGGRRGAGQQAGGDPAMDPVYEAGGGESEGFELAERELIEHASHGDLHAAERAAQDAPGGSEDARAAQAAEADVEDAGERDG